MCDIMLHAGLHGRQTSSWILPVAEAATYTSGQRQRCRPQSSAALKLCREGLKPPPFAGIPRLPAALPADLTTDMVQIGYVKGIDLSPGEIREAQMRFDNFSSQRRGV